MLPKKVKKRASLLAITLLISVIGIFFILQSLNKNILYFKSPTDIKNNQNIKIKFKTNNCILMVFCDREYEFEDYIEDYKNFLKIVKKK